ncbi:MAG: hypothetical protein ACWGO1_00890 [Anaerolineales bacterium]
MLAQVTHILPITQIRRERLLPAAGRVTVRKGQKVSATDVIAEVRLAPEHMLLDVARGLGLPAKEADRYLQCHEGDQVAEGDVLAGPVGFTKRVIRASKNGRVIVAGDGQILLELEGPPFELKSGLPGSVAELVGDRGAIIETNGALIQGVWGNGRIDSGLMNVLASSPDEELRADRLDVSLRGSVVMGGVCLDAQVLRVGGELPLRGLILGSMDASLLPYAAKARYPVIVLDAIGRYAMNMAAFKLLSTNERRDVAINAEMWDRYTGKRPEVIIPLPATGNLGLSRDTVDFLPGQKVLVTRQPYARQIGTLQVVRPGLTLLPNGIKAPAGEIQLENGEYVVVPLVNLEVLA